MLMFRSGADLSSQICAHLHNLPSAAGQFQSQTIYNLHNNINMGLKYAVIGVQ